MDTNDATQEINSTKPRSLKPYIIELGCFELEELSALRSEGWNDASLSGQLNHHFSTLRKRADESTSEDDAYWLPLMASALAQIDKQTHCIPKGGPLHFLDLGCCPGGFSKYVLTKNPMSQGLGVSLEVENGGHGLAIPSPECSRFRIHWGDLTYYDICLPTPRPSSPLTNGPALLQTPFCPGGFQLAILDAHHRRPQESPLTHPWDIDRLLIAQLIIGIQSLDLGGSLVVKLHHVESSTTARLLYMIDKLFREIIVFKPHVHATRSSFYAIGRGLGLGIYWNKRQEYLQNLKNVWWELTYGGPNGQGRWLNEDDLDFIVDFETLRQTYLDRLIQLGRQTWRVQSLALMSKYTRIRKDAARRNEA